MLGVVVGARAIGILVDHTFAESAKVFFPELVLLALSIAGLLTIRPDGDTSAPQPHGGARRR